MNISSPFIDRPVATTLLTIGVVLAGAVAFRLLPVSPLPRVDLPTISVSASLPGASPETMAATVAMPLERSLGLIAGVTEMTSTSALGSSRIVLQFDLDRDINGAARDVQAAINAARSSLPTGLNGNPSVSQGQSRRCADHDPGAHVGDDDAGADVRRRVDDHRAEALAARGRGPGPGRRQLASRGARRDQPAGALQVRHRLRGRAHGARVGQRQPPERRRRRRRAQLADRRQRPGEDRPRVPAADRRLSQRRPGGAHRRRGGRRLRAGPAQCGIVQRQAVGARDREPAAERQHHRDRRSRDGAHPHAARVDSGRHRSPGDDGAHHDHSRVAARRRPHARACRWRWSCLSCSCSCATAGRR